MLYFELGLNYEDYLTNKECRRSGKTCKIIWWVKSKLGIILKKKIDNKFVYVIPEVNKKFLKKVEKIIKVSGDKQICISDELFYKNEFLSLCKKNDIYICDSSWIKKYILINLLEYIKSMVNIDFSSVEIAFLVKDDYEKLSKYIMYFADKFKIITVVTNNIKYFSKIRDKIYEKDGIDINIVNNYKKSLLRTKIIVNLDFGENEIKKYNIANNVYFINLDNKYEIDNKKFKGINITNVQISMPDRYLQYAELFKNFNYMNVYESFIKKRTSMENIIKEIKNDNLNIICLENNEGIVKKEDFLCDIDKILDK